MSVSCVINLSSCQWKHTYVCLYFGASQAPLEGQVIAFWLYLFPSAFHFRYLLGAILPENALPLCWCQNLTDWSSNKYIKVSLLLCDDEMLLLYRVGVISSEIVRRRDVHKSILLQCARVHWPIAAPDRAINIACVFEYTFNIVVIQVVHKLSLVQCVIWPNHISLALQWMENLQTLGKHTLTCPSDWWLKHNTAKENKVMLWHLLGGVGFAQAHSAFDNKSCSLELIALKC